MSYPDQLLRGIPDNNFLIEGLPAGHLFSFDAPKTPRQDDNKECSINWRDNNNSIILLLREEKEPGKLKYKEGIAVLSLRELQRLNRKPLCNGNLNYERNKIPGNPYHGNLLLSNNISKKKTQYVGSAIATTCFLEIIPSSAAIEKVTPLSTLINLIRKFLKNVFYLPSVQ